MRYQSIILLALLFGLIGVSIFFGSNPFAQPQDYNCLTQNINTTICNEVNGTNMCQTTTETKSVNVCSATNDTTELSLFAKDVNTETAKIHLKDFMPLSIGTPIVNSNGLCSYNDVITCQGANVSNGLIVGKKYLVKQVYDNKTAPCDTNIRATYYFQDCTGKGLIQNVCSAGRCIKYPFQNLFYQLMEKIGFKP